MMGQGMAHYARIAEQNNGVFSVQSMGDFDLYCHYVAGIVGEGLSRIFAASDLENPIIGKQLTLSNSMGLMLQKVNILRDFREDIDQGRLFWPKAIWGKEGINDPRELTLPENADKAQRALSAMTLDALLHTVDCLEYLSILTNQSVFNFCAIPQVMAIATLNVCFGNLDVFQRNVKIRRTQAAGLIMRSVNPREVGIIVRENLLEIHRKMKPSDPSYIGLSVLIGRVLTWLENKYPSWIDLEQPLPKTRAEAEKMGIMDVRIQQLPSDDALDKERERRLTQASAEDTKALIWIVIFSLALVFLLLFLSCAVLVRRFAFPSYPSVLNLAVRSSS